MDLYLCFDIDVIRWYSCSIEEDVVIIVISIIDFYGRFVVVSGCCVKVDVVILVVVWGIGFLFSLILFIFKVIWDLSYWVGKESC